MAGHVVDIDNDSTWSLNIEKSQAASTKRRNNLIVIPVIPKPLAIFCLVANILLPGSGTIVSAFSVFCFYSEKENFLRMASICVGNVVMGLCQLITVMFILIGWIWSFLWGCALVGYSKFYKKGDLTESQTPVAAIELSEKPPSVSQARNHTI